MPVSAETQGVFSYTVSANRATITNCDKEASGIVEVPSELGGYPVITIGASAFKNCTSITEVVLPSSIIAIREEAFYDCSSMQSINIPEQTETIGYFAFGNCKKLLSISILGSVKSIGNYVFLNCSRLEGITVSEGNQYYSSVDGVLFSKDKTELVCYPGGLIDRSYFVPDNVEIIHEGAFSFNTKIVDICLPESVTSIGSMAFFYCTILRSVNIPADVTSIGLSVFSDCPKLTVKLYDGSYAQDYATANNVPYELLNDVDVTGMSMDANGFNLRIRSVREVPEDTVVLAVFYGYDKAPYLSSVSFIDQPFQGILTIPYSSIPDNIVAFKVLCWDGPESMDELMEPYEVTEFIQAAD